MKQKSKQQVGAWPIRSGVSFRVWAPFADLVELAGSFNGWQRLPMQSEGDGYWCVEVKGAKQGQEYKYVIHKGDAIFYKNDPRSAHLTIAAGNSVIASTHFDWTDGDFRTAALEEQVIYELHIGTFNRPDPAITGTFHDVLEKLDYLASLGVNVIEIIPVATMSMDRGWGYAPEYIYAVESLYGGRHQFLEFVNAAHEKGIAVVLDVVYNHFGPDNNDLWQFDGWSENNKGGIYFYNDWRSATPWGDTRPDYGRFEVQQYILDNVRMLMHDCHLDGLRVDSTIYIRTVYGHNDDPGNDLPEGWHLLQQINSVARKINPNAITVAEDIAYNEYVTKHVNEGGAGFSAQWELGFPQAMRDSLWTNDISKINTAPLLTQLSRTYNNDAFQRIIFVDSHDSAGEYARFAEVMSPGKTSNLHARRQTLIAAAVTLTAPGVPMIFQGQEFMLGGAFNDWEGLDWEKAERYTGIVEAHKHLIALRKNSQGVTAGLTGRGLNVFHIDESNKVIGYHRWKNGGPKDDTIVLINLADKQHDVYEISFPRDGVWAVRFNSTWKGYAEDFDDVYVGDINVANNKGSFILPPCSVLILSQDT